MAGIVILSSGYFEREGMTESFGRATVLIVDDNIEELRALADILAEEGYDVRPFIHGRLAIRAAIEKPPTIILLDPTMPEMDGYPMSERLRQIEGLRETPKIFLLSGNDTEDRIRTFAAGAADYLMKPYLPQEVHARLYTHVALRRAQLELRKNVERLEDVEQLRHDLVNMVVHDMRAPLTVLLAQLDSARSEAKGTLGERGIEHLEGAFQAAEILRRTATDLLDVSRLEEGKMPIVLSACDLTRVAHHVRATMAHWEPARMIELDVQGSAEVACDERVIYRVLENLVTNAIKYTPEEGVIRISIAASAGRVRVAVADEGPGIPPEARERIFEKFATVSTTDRGEHSAGLGLAFCKLAVEAHDGSIGVDEGENGGSVFWFELPVIH